MGRVSGTNPFSPSPRYPEGTSWGGYPDEISLNCVHRRASLRVLYTMPAKGMRTSAVSIYNRHEVAGDENIRYHPTNPSRPSRMAG